MQPLRLPRAQYALALATLQEDNYYVSALKGEAIPDDATGTSLNTLIQAQLSLKIGSRYLEPDGNRCSL